jgi:hypothetical protein
MRWSGLAIRDAVTLERRRLNEHGELFLYRVSVCDLRVLVWPQDIGIGTRQRVRCQVFGQCLCPLPMNLPIVSIGVPKRR